MFIQTETTANPSVIKFLPGERVTDSQTIEFLDEEAANGSPLALRLFQVGGIEKLSLGADYIEVCKVDESEWQHLKPQILGALVEHFMSGDPVFVDEADGQQSADRQLEAIDLDCSSELAVQVKELTTGPRAGSRARRALFSRWLPHHQTLINCSVQQRGARPTPTPA